FGKFLKTVEPGLHFKLPLGIDQVTVLPTRRQVKLEFGFVTSGYTNPDQPGKDAQEERSMVTGDLNAALVEWVVQYRIDDPKQYLFDVRNPAQTLRDLSKRPCAKLSVTARWTKSLRSAGKISRSLPSPGCRN